MTEKIIEKKESALRFHTIHTDRFKMSRMSFNFVLPADAYRSPLTRLTLAVLMRGCRKYPTVVDLNKRVDNLYGATVTWRATSLGSCHVFKISCEMLRDQYRFAGDTESIIRGVCDTVLDILFDPLLDGDGLLSEAHFESEKKLAIDAIRAKINDQKAYAAEKCWELMLSDHPAGISVEGDEAQIRSFTLREVTENLYWFLENAALECYYVGGDDVDGVIEEIADRFATLKREGARSVGSENRALREEGSPIREKEETMNVSQGRLHLGYKSGVVMCDRDYYALCLFNEIFGGSSVSKLFMNVREKKSLCYYCYSSYHSATGCLTVGCGIKRENKDKAQKEIERQLHEMKKGRFTEEEIESARRSILSGLRQISDSPASMEAFAFRRVLAGIEETVEETMERVMSVTPAEIVAVAERVKLDTVYFLAGNGEEEYEDE